MRIIAILLDVWARLFSAKNRWAPHILARKRGFVLTSGPILSMLASGCLCLCLCVGCQFQGGTALPPLPGLDVTTPSGYRIKADSNLKGTLVFKDGQGKEIEVKLKQDVAGVVDSQAGLAQSLEGLAKIDAARQKAILGGLVDAFKVGLAAANPLPEVPIGPVVP